MLSYIEHYHNIDELGKHCIVHKSGKYIVHGDEF